MYMLVENNKAGDLRMEVDMDKGDTLQVFVGHHVNDKRIYSRNLGPMEIVRFCIF